MQFSSGAFARIIIIVIIIIINLLTPWNCVLLEKLIISHLLKKWNLEAHCRLHKNPPLGPVPNQVNPVAPSHPDYLRFTLILSYLRLGLPSGLFPSDIPTKPFCALLSVVY
jgi:hypothetical protein